MPPKKTSGEDAPIPFPWAGGGHVMNGRVATENDLRFVNAVLSNLTARPDVDWDAVASALALKDTKCTKERWRQIRNKFGWNDDGSASGSGGFSPTKVTKRTARAVAKTRKTPSEPPTPKKAVVTPELGTGVATVTGAVVVSAAPAPRKKLPDEGRPKNASIKEIKLDRNAAEDAGVV